MSLRLPATALSVLFLFLTASTCTSADPPADQAKQRMNVLMICVDDLRPELNCFGKSYIHSPNIDRLAASGRAFTRHYVQAPTCGASRYALLTGTYGGSNNDALFRRAAQMQSGTDVTPSMPAWFRKNGYTTVSVGKVSHHPGGRGGADWDDDNKIEMPGSWDRHLLPSGDWQHPRGVMHGLANGEIRKNAKDMDVYQSTEGPDEIYPDGLIVNEALDQLDQLSADQQKPFFLAVGIIRPHLPFGAPAKYMQHYQDTKLPAIEHPNKPTGKTTWHGSGEFMKYNRWGRNPNTDPEFADLVRRHSAACVTYADAQVGKLLDHLKANGQAERTIIVLWGDHGWNLGEHAIWGKHCLFEESLRSPLIIHHPDMKGKGKASNAIVETVDIFPTLCDLAKLPEPKFAHGMSLTPWLQSPQKPGFTAVAYRSNAKTIRSDTHRMIAHKDGHVELYDHRSEAGETNNVAKNHPALVNLLTKELTRRLEFPRAKKKPSPKAFSWVNPLPASAHPRLKHHTFHSKLIGKDVGYVTLLPDNYDESDQRYPVVYYLHGGRPGGETKSIKLADHLVRLSEENELPQMIYVFVNGGPVSHYNVPDQIGKPGAPQALGADVFIKELIPHVDNSYRTIADRKGRGLEGFSQGGRGTMRLSLRYPELFSSVAAGGGGYETEHRISQSPDGAESPNLKFAIGDNTWDLARSYTKQADAPKINLMLYVGTKGFNYENNLQYMKFLKEQGIDHQALIVPDVPHSATGIYEKQGLKIMQFHAKNFAASR